MMSFRTTPDTRDPSSGLPEVDQRLVTPETRFEIEDGRWIYVPPADERHGESHSRVDGLLRAHRAAGYSVAIDMLTRTSQSDDLAPDVSVYPTARDSRTRGRQLEELAFEIASTESLVHAGAKAARLVSRGVRRVFALDLQRARALEWSKEAGQWSILDLGARIVDPALAVPLPIEALLDAALADDAIVRAWRSRRHAEFIAERAEGREEGRAEGRAEALFIVLGGRGLEPTEAERRCILQERDLGRLERWLAAARTCADVAELLATP